MARGDRQEHGGLCAERLETLLRQHLRWLRGWLGARLRGVDRQDVDDLCQDVLLRAVRGIDKLRDPARFSSWLYSIANNVVRDHIRDAARKREQARGLEMNLPDPRGAIDVVAGREELERAIDTVLELPPRYREPMLLLHVDDLGYDEIGAILGITSNAVQVRISRARQKLRKTKVYRQLYERSATEAVGSAEAPGIESRHTTPTPDPSCSSRVSGSLRS